MTDNVHVLGHQARSLGDEIGLADGSERVYCVVGRVGHVEDIIKGVGLAGALGQTDLRQGLVVVLGNLTRAVVDVALWREEKRKI